MREAHGDKAIGLITGFCPKLFHRQLCQAAGGQRVDAAADTQYQYLEARVAQALLDKRLALFDLRHQCGGVGKGRHNIKCRSDFGLAVAHFKVLTGSKTSGLCRLRSRNAGGNASSVSVMTKLTLNRL